MPAAVRFPSENEVIELEQQLVFVIRTKSVDSLGSFYWPDASAFEKSPVSTDDNFDMLAQFT